MNKSCAQCISHYIYRKRVSIVVNKSISTNAYVKNDNYVNNLFVYYNSCISSHEPSKEPLYIEDKAKRGSLLQCCLDRMGNFQREALYKFSLKKKA
jgi:hypothetical protein